MCLGGLIITEAMVPKWCSCIYMLHVTANQHFGRAIGSRLPRRGADTREAIQSALGVCAKLVFRGRCGMST